MKLIYPYILISLCLFGISGCQSGNKPDLARLYHFDNQNTSQHPPLILIHGITGSKLRDKETKKEIWYGNLSRLIFSNYQEIKLEIDEQTLAIIPSKLEAYEILDRISGFNVYEEIVETLTEFGNYQITTLNDSINARKRSLYLFTYDWRNDNVTTAQQLADFIAMIKKQHGNPELKMDVVAHSMGGLVLRYYMRYGGKDVLGENDFIFDPEPTKNIRKAILLGTPNLGSVLSVYRFVNGLKFNVRTIPVEVLMTMPSIYQILPHSLNNWLLDIYGEKMSIDIFDIENWKKYKWAIFSPEIREKILQDSIDVNTGHQQIATLELFFAKHLERARRFLWSLSVAVPDSDHEFIVMGGDCEMTPARLVFEKVDNEYLLSKKPSQIKNKIKGIDYNLLMLEPGDGLVTKASALAKVHLNPELPRNIYSYFPLKYPFFLCANHNSLTSNINFQDNLLHTLLSADL